MSSPLIKLVDIHKKFLASKSIFEEKRYVHALNGVSLEINRGETLSIVGESGCGKSTLGRVLNKLIDSTQGEVWYEDTNITNFTPKQMIPIRRRMQMVFQDPYGCLNPRMKIKDIVGEPLLVHSDMSKQDRYNAVIALLETVGLNERHAQGYAHEFSGGQRQRIGIARALTVNPELIIADEPVSALDVSIQAQVINIFKGLQNDFNLTYLFISHDLSVVEMISDRIGVMYLGHLVEITTKEELYKNPLHPYTQALLSAVPIADPTYKKKRIILKGDIPSPIDMPRGCPFNTRCMYVKSKCLESMPNLIEAEKGHRVACHLISGG